MYGRIVRFLMIRPLSRSAGLPDKWRQILSFCCMGVKRVIAVSMFFVDKQNGVGLLLCFEMLGIEGMGLDH